MDVLMTVFAFPGCLSTKSCLALRRHSEGFNENPNKQL